MAVSAERRGPGRRFVAARIAGAMAVLTMSLVYASVGGAGVASASPQITGTGSSFAALAILQWAADLSNYGENINYSTQSSVVGLNQFAAQSVDFGASEIGYSTDQAPAPGFAYQYLPDVAGGIAFAYNLQDANGQPVKDLRLSPSTLLGIWTDKIQNWDDQAIQADNPGVALPNLPIKVIYRSDGAGESYILSEYFDYLFPTEWEAYLHAINQAGAPLTAYYPVYQPGNPVPPGYNFDNWLGQSGSDAAAHYVSESGSDGAMTYVETSWALYYHLPVASLQNPSSAYVQPSSLDVSVALEKAVLYKDLEEDLDGVFTNPLPDSYPLSSYSYILTQESQISASKGQALSKFIYYLACQGQDQTIQLGYSPIPPNLVADDFAAAQRLNGHLAPPPLTASGCPNPYIDGQLPLPGEPVVLLIGPTGGHGGSPSGGGGAAAQRAASPTGSSGSSGPGAGTGTGTASTVAGSTSGATVNGAGGSTTVPTDPLSGDLARSAHSLAAASGIDTPMGFVVVALLLLCFLPPLLIRQRRAAQITPIVTRDEADETDAEEAS